MASGLRVDVENEFETLLAESAMLAGVLPALNALDADKARRWIEVAGVAAAIEKIYSGCERVMILLAKRVDDAPIDKSDGWHATLLKRMAHDFPGVRGPILSSDCLAGLDRFRSFRHRVRNSYGVELDGDIVIDRAEELVRVLTLFHGEVSQFLTAWEGGKA
jgi:hypothetical protein